MADDHDSSPRAASTAGAVSSGAAPSGPQASGPPASGPAPSRPPAAADIITELGNEVFQIDTRMAGYGGVTAGYLIRGDRPCLVETGTAPSAPVVRDALTELGIGPSDLATVVVTHIHLDHAGGSGDIARMFPQAQIVVHEYGAPHLADPERLNASARMVYGDELDELFGELTAIPAERIRAVDRRGSIDLGGGRRLDTHHSPGHAKHHVGLIDSVSGDLYVGDAAGIYVQATGDMLPATPPPEFDLNVALDSLRLFRSLQPTRLLFSHYGPVDAVDQTLQRSAEEIQVWVEATKAAKRAGLGLNLDHAAAMVRERTRHRYAVMQDPEAAARYERTAPAAGNVAGILFWLGRSGQ